MAAQARPEPTVVRSTRAGVRLPTASPPRTQPCRGARREDPPAHRSRGAQSNDKDQVSLEPSNRLACAAPRCSKLAFTYKPAKGVKGDLMFRATWTNPGSDLDLYVGEVARDGSASDIGQAGASARPARRVFIPASSFKPGKTDVMVIDYYRSLNETVKDKVEIAAPSSLKTTVPAQHDGQLPGTMFPVNCTL